MDIVTRAGEVIEASTGEFTAQCYELHQAPPLGSLVKTRDVPIDIFGIVYNAETHGIEPGRRPLARGEAEESEEEIFRSNPQLVKLLCTDFKALVVGHREGDNLYHYLPPRPARIHSFVYVCQLDEVKDFTKSLDFLSLLVGARVVVPIDEVVAAYLRSCSKAYPDSQAFLVRAGKELAVLLGGELNRLNSILKKLRR